MKLYSIETGKFKLDGGAMFGVVPKVLWQEKYPADENNLCNWALRCLLVVTGDRRILIDTGIGDKQDEKFLKHYYLHGEDALKKSLTTCGFSAGEITDVIVTHLHFDHCGGSITYNADTKKFEPVFKNAIYWISKQQWESAINPNAREKTSFLKENILPIKENGSLKVIEHDAELYPDVSVRLYHGHTDGMVIPFINYHGKMVVFMADLFPSTVHIPISYVMSYDIRPLQTLKEKEAFLIEAVEHDYILFFEHDVFNECCTVQNTEKGVRVKETFTLREYFQ